VSELAYNYHEGLPGRDFNMERLLRVWAAPAVSNPVGANVVWIEAFQISGDEDGVVAGACRSRVDRHALS
jgi:hypothetical protein